MKKPKAATVGEKIAEHAFHDYRFGKEDWQKRINGITRRIDSALKRAAREAAWDGWDQRSVAMIPYMIEKKYGKRPARRTRCDPKT